MSTALLGGAFGLGLLLICAGNRRSEPPPEQVRVAGLRRPDDDFTLSLASLVVGGVIAFAITGWPVGALLIGLGAAAVPRTLREGRGRREVVRRAEAVATWAEMLRDTMAAAAGMEEAITSTAAVAPFAIRPQVQRLAARLEKGRLRPTLQQFASEVSDPTADLVVAALLITVEHHARDLGGMLGALAASARMEAAMILRVEAGRSRLRTAARVVGITTLGFAAVLVLFNQSFLEPYDDATGQMWLLVVGSLFAVGVREMGRMSRIAVAPRVLASSAVLGDG